MDSKIISASFIDRIQSQEELAKLLSICFEEKMIITKDEFRRIIFEKSSDMFIPLYSIIRKSIPVQTQLKFITKNFSNYFLSQSSEISSPKVLFKTNIVNEILMNSPQISKTSLPLKNKKDDVLSFEKINLIQIQGDFDSAYNKMGIMQNVGYIKNIKNPNSQFKQTSIIMNSGF